MTQVSTTPVVSEEQTSQADNIKKIVLAGIIGNIIEWYDFALFGYFAPVISTLFFPNDNELTSLLETYGVFAAGFIMRPIGATVFGYIGDRIGRRIELFISVLLMALPTFMLGLLPDYAHIGIAAPITLVVLRLIQGLSVGGEFTGSVTYVAETAPQNHRGFMASFTNFGSMSGTLLGLGIVTLMTNLLPDADLRSWGWRLAFLLGGVLGLVGFYIRQNLPASEVFQEQQDESEMPLLTAFRQSWVPMVQTIVYTGGYSTVFYILLVYLPTYLDKFTDIALNQALLINTVVIALLLPITPLMGWLSDFTLRRKVWLLIAVISLASLGFPAFLLFQQGTLPWIWVAQITLVTPIGILLGVSPTMMVELFPTKTRLTTYSVSFNVGVSLLGGTSPLIVTWLIDVSNNVYVPAIYLIVSAVMAAIAVSFMVDRSREPLL